MSDSDYLKEQRRLRRSESLLIVFEGAVGADNRDAVTLTTWAAEKHADVVTLASARQKELEDGRRGQQIDPEAWLKAFESVLLKLGWVGDFAFTTREIPEDVVRAKATELLAREFEDEKSSVRLQLERSALSGDWPSDPRLVGIVRESGDQLSIRTLLIGATRLPTAPAVEGTEAEPGSPLMRLFARTLEATLVTLQFERIKDALLEKLREAPKQPPSAF